MFVVHIWYRNITVGEYLDLLIYDCSDWQFTQDLLKERLLPSHSGDLCNSTSIVHFYHSGLHPKDNTINIGGLCLKRPLLIWSSDSPSTRQAFFSRYVVPSSFLDIANTVIRRRCLSFLVASTCSVNSSAAVPSSWQYVKAPTRSNFVREPIA